MRELSFPLCLSQLEFSNCISKTSKLYLNNSYRKVLIISSLCLYLLKKSHDMFIKLYSNRSFMKFYEEKENSAKKSGKNGNRPLLRINDVPFNGKMWFSLMLFMILYFALASSNSSSLVRHASTNFIDDKNVFTYTRRSNSLDTA